MRLRILMQANHPTTSNLRMSSVPPVTFDEALMEAAKRKHDGRTQMAGATEGE